MRAETGSADLPLGAGVFVALGVHTGQSVPVPQSQRDLQWDALYTASERLAAKYGQQVRAKQRHRFLTVTGGFETAGRFFPVYERSLFNRRWRELRPIGEVASEVGELLKGSSA
jgi:hypothetical protein